LELGILLKVFQLMMFLKEIKHSLLLLRFYLVVVVHLQWHPLASVCKISDIVKEKFFSLQESISSTFYMLVFVRKQIEQLFSSYIWLCNFLRKNISAKGTHNMLMKLTPDNKPPYSNNPRQVPIIFLHLAKNVRAEKGNP